MDDEMEPTSASLLVLRWVTHSAKNLAMGLEMCLAN